MINKENYILFFIDYVDGNLSAEAIAELILFLELNPDLKEDFELLKQSPQLTAAQETKYSSSKKNNLKKIIYTSDEQNYALVAELENNLTTQDASILKSIPPKTLTSERKLYGLTRATPDLSIVFEKKSILKKSPPAVRYLFYYVSGIAATVLVAIMFFGWYHLNNKPTVAIKNNSTIHPSKNNQPLATYTLPEKKQTKSTYQSNQKKQYASIHFVTRTTRIKQSVILDTINVVKELISNKAETQVQVIENNNSTKNNYDESSNSQYTYVSYNSATNTTTETNQTLSVKEWAYQSITGELPKTGRYSKLANLTKLATGGIEKIGKKSNIIAERTY